MLNQILFEKNEQEKLIRVEHTLPKASLVLEKKLPLLKPESHTILEFVYLLKNHKEQILKKFVEDFSPEKHGQIEVLRIMNSHLNAKDVDFILENTPALFSHIKELNLMTNTSFDVVCHKKLFAANPFHNLTILNLKNNKLITDAIFTDLQDITTIRELNLNNTGVSDSGLFTLVKSKLFENLHTLVLSRNHQMINLKAFTTEDAARGTNLRHLDLSFTKIIPQGLNNLKKIPFISELEILDLSDNREMIEDSELELLYDFKGDDNKQVKFNLKRLYLKNIRLTTPLLNVILSNDMQHLEYLDLEGNENLFTDLKSVEDLKNTSILNKLVTLSIRKAGLSEKSAALLIPHLKAVKHFDISYNELINEEALQLIFDLLLQNNVSLISLGLGALNLTQQSIKLIFSKFISVVSTLKHFYVRENLELKDDIVSVIIGTKDLKLSYLNVSACNITNDAYVELLKNENLQSNIEDIRLSENNELRHDEVLVNLVTYLPKLVNLRRMSLGSSFTNDEDIPKELVNSKIQLSPFFCDDLD